MAGVIPQSWIAKFPTFSRTQIPIKLNFKNYIINLTPWINEKPFKLLPITSLDPKLKYHILSEAAKIVSDTNNLWTHITFLINFSEKTNNTQRTQFHIANTPYISRLSEHNMKKMIHVASNYFGYVLICNTVSRNALD